MERAEAPIKVSDVGVSKKKKLGKKERMKARANLSAKSPPAATTGSG